MVLNIKAFKYLFLTSVIFIKDTDLGNKMSPKVDLLVKNKFLIGEGPHWDDINQRLLFVDIAQSNVHRWNYCNSQLDEPIHVEGEQTSK